MRREEDVLYKKRSWGSFGLSLAFVGGGGILMAISAWKQLGFIQWVTLVLGLGGILLLVVGIGFIIWDEKPKWEANKSKKIDKNAEYTFWQVTDRGRERITDFSQIEQAVKAIEQTRGSVKYEITPAMGDIVSYEVVYENGYYVSYVQRKREGGLECWREYAGDLLVAVRDLAILYKKHKKLSYDYFYKCEGRRKKNEI